MTKRLIAGLLLLLLVFAGFQTTSATNSYHHSQAFFSGNNIPQAIVNRCLYLACNAWSLSIEDVCDKHKTGEIEITEIQPGETYKVTYYLTGGGLMEIVEDL